MVDDAQPPAHAIVPGDVSDFVRDLAALWDRQLGKDLAGVYLIGSLAHGGYSTRYSDIDVALIVERPLAGAELDRINKGAVLRSAALASKVSLFWTDAKFSAGRFPILDRIDYLDHAVPLLERRHVAPVPPTLRQVHAYLRAEALDRWSRQVARFAALDDLVSSDYRTYLRTLLYPGRFLYSWETGHVASNDDAVVYVGRRNLFGADYNVVARALRCRNDGDDPASLFSERGTLPRLLSICTKHAREKS
jgi:hypothetical protein